MASMLIGSKVGTIFGSLNVFSTKMMEPLSIQSIGSIKQSNIRTHHPEGCSCLVHKSTNNVSNILEWISSNLLNRSSNPITITLEEKGGIFLNVPKQKTSTRRKRLHLLSTKLSPVKSYKICPDCGTPIRSLHLCPCIQRRLLKSETLFSQSWHRAINKVRGVFVDRDAEIKEVYDAKIKRINRKEQDDSN